jgi:hypothetical protein
MLIVIKKEDGKPVFCNVHHGKLPEGTLGLTTFDETNIPSIRISPEAYVAGPAVYMGVLIHEIAHATSNDLGHGPKWRKEAFRLADAFAGLIGVDVPVVTKDIARAVKNGKGGK